MPRRALLGAAALSAAAASGCGRRARGGAAPQPAPAAVTLRFAPVSSAIGPGGGASQQGVFDVLEPALQPFLDAHPGVNVRLVGPAGAAAIAGDAAADVATVSGSYAKVLQPEYALDLSEAVRTANYDLGVFDAGQMAVYRRANGLYALPAYLGSAAMIVNESALDALNLARPNPDPTSAWPWRQWLGLWNAAADPERGRLGTSLFWATGHRPAAFYLRGWGGSYRSTADAQLCTLDSAGSIACGEALFPLVWRGVAGTSAMDVGGFAAGRLVTATAWVQVWIRPGALQRLGTASGWRFYPLPTWPAGAASYANRDCRLVPARSRHPRQAAELLLWASSDPGVQRALMKTWLLPPTTAHLWDEWQSTVEAVAPNLSERNVGVFKYYPQHGAAFPFQLFGYEHAVAEGIIGDWLGRLQARKVSVKQAFTQAARAVNALEARAPRRRASAAATG